MIQTEKEYGTFLERIEVFLNEADNIENKDTRG
jgi:hypothetical protein